MLCHSNLVRKNMIDKLRKKGNFLHNKDVKTSGTGELKLRRQPKKKYTAKDYVDCMYCKAMYLRQSLWRHARICPSKPPEEVEEAEAGYRRTRILALASMTDYLAASVSSNSRDTSTNA